MNSLNSVLSQCLDNPTRAARAVQRSGGRVIGYVGADIPVELIHAAGAFPLSLPSRAPGATVLADAYLEASFTPAERSIADQWLAGDFDFIEAVIFTRASDSAQRLYYYLCELQRRHLTAGPKPLLYDLAKIPRASSAEHSLAATQTLANAIGTHAERLLDAIQLRNRRRELLLQLQSLREGRSPPSGVQSERIDRAADRYHALEFDQALSQWLERPGPSHAGPRIVLSGSAPPDGRLHEAVEQVGGVIVAEAGTHALERFGSPIVAGADPIRALAQHYHELPFGSRTFSDRTSGLLERVEASHADGVILWLIEEEEAFVWELPDQLQMLKAHAIPVLNLSRRRWDAGDGALEAIQEFTSSLGART